MATIIEERLRQYSPKTSEEEHYALKEILQEIILCGLSDAGFFKEAFFQGGTSLRIFYNLQRFSEDLDFILKKPNPDFKWKPFIEAIEYVCEQYGVVPSVIDKSKAGTTIQKMLLKDNSIAKLLNLSFRYPSDQKLTIKLEIDTNPPEGSTAEIKFLRFPSAAEVVVQDLSSNFGGKSHALLCRKYVKGRDWYDFDWYVSKKIVPNFTFLSHAIDQQGPWAGQGIELTPEWTIQALNDKIHTINWSQAEKEVSPFLNEADRKTLKLWGVPFFLDRLEKLKEVVLEAKNH
ncbi:MAG: nucleotidyl transferase AbiEii/AbiGii toxin family protein [Gammaproteobacteria bacterium]|nr:nucleotidyl transferase AbiEii/AbiGii toxin family protein [Gammaproteobacteria bacterium]MBP9729409.1 nucleotidyl transferase AbiEii/AbiGii toxin family protein [Gammaproteobacteria bacterium]